MFKNKNEQSQPEPSATPDEEDVQAEAQPRRRLSRKALAALLSVTLTGGLAAAAARLDSFPNKKGGQSAQPQGQVTPTPETEPSTTTSTVPETTSTTTKTTIANAKPRTTTNGEVIHGLRRPDQLPGYNVKVPEYLTEQLTRSNFKLFRQDKKGGPLEYWCNGVGLRYANFGSQGNDEYAIATDAHCVDEGYAVQTLPNHTANAEDISNEIRYDYYASDPGDVNGEKPLAKSVRVVIDTSGKLAGLSLITVDNPSILQGRSMDANFQDITPGNELAFASQVDGKVVNNSLIYIGKSKHWDPSRNVINAISDPKSSTLRPGDSGGLAIGPRGQLAGTLLGVEKPSHYGPPDGTISPLMGAVNPDLIIKQLEDQTQVTTEGKFVAQFSASDQEIANNLAAVAFS